MASDVPDEAALATPDLPDEAVEAAYVAFRKLGYPSSTPKTVVSYVLAAAAAHLRAEVDAALRDNERYLDWLRNTRAMSTAEEPFTAASITADYLRDTLGAGGDGEG